MGRLAFREERNSIFVLYLDDKISHASHRAFELTDRGFLSMFVFDIFTSSMQPSTVNVLGGGDEELLLCLESTHGLLGPSLKEGIKLRPVLLSCTNILF